MAAEVKVEILTPTVKQRVKRLRREYDRWWKFREKLARREEKGKYVSANAFERSDDWIAEIGQAAMDLLTDKKVVVKERKPKKALCPNCKHKRHDRIACYHGDPLCECVWPPIPYRPGLQYEDTSDGQF